MHIRGYQVDPFYHAYTRSGEELECQCGNKFDGIDFILTRIDRLFGISWNIHPEVIENMSLNF